MPIPRSHAYNVIRIHTVKIEIYDINFFCRIQIYSCLRITVLLRSVCSVPRVTTVNSLGIAGLG